MKEIERQRRLALARGKAALAEAAFERRDWIAARDLYATAGAIAEGYDDALWRECIFYRACSLDEIGQANEDPASLTEAIVLFRDVLRARAIEEGDTWFLGLHNAALAGALVNLGLLRKDAALLTEAVAAHRAAISSRPAEAVPEHHARSQYNLGVTLMDLAQLEPDRRYLEEALAAYRAALAATEDPEIPYGRAETLRRAAVACAELAEHDEAYFRDSLAYFFQGLREAHLNEEVPLAQLIAGQMKSLLMRILRIEHYCDKLGYIAEFFAFLDADILSDLGHEIYGQFSEIQEIADELRAVLDLGPMPKPSPSDPAPLPAAHHQPGVRETGISEGLDLKLDVPPPPKAPGVPRDEQSAIAKKLGGYAEAAADRGDYRGAAGFYGAAAAAMAPFDEAEECAYLELQGEMLLHHGFPYLDTKVLRQALHLYSRRLLPMKPRSTHPQGWAKAQANIGMIYRYLGIADDDPVTLTHAAAHLRAALEVVTPAASPERWCRLQLRLGGVLGKLFELGDGDWYVQDAIDAFFAALELISQEEEPRLWATTLRDVAVLLLHLAERSGDPDHAKLALKGFEPLRDLLAGTGTGAGDEVQLQRLDEQIAKARKLAGL